MCIAIYSPLGSDIPREDYLKQSWNSNPDGAGFAYNTDDGRVKIQKGFMTYDNFINSFRAANEKYDFKNRGVLIHFRITTHGGTCKECCHPFPLVGDEGALKKLEYTADYAVIHNGIIDLTSLEAYKRQKMSDTMVFIEKYLSKIASNKRWFKNDTNFELIYSLIDSKMAVLNGQGVIKSTYGFTQDADGNWYSNETYKASRCRNLTKYYDWYDDPSYEEWWNTKHSSTTKYRMALELRRGEFVMFDDGDYLEYDDTMPVYVTRDGEVYIGEKNLTSGEVAKDIMYYGEGMVFDSMFREVKRSTDRTLAIKGESKA